MGEKYDSVADMPDALREKLGRFVTDVDGSTFAIHGLPLELTGGLLARYSRAPTGLRETLVREFLGEDGEPNQEKGSALMDRVLNAFGDESVGELENMHVGVEDISQLGTKFVEDKRIGGSPIEQSTRYVRYDKKGKDGQWRYLRPPEVMRSSHGTLFETVNDRAFEVYSKGIGLLMDHFRGEVPRDSFEIKVQRDGQDVMAKESELRDDTERKAFKMAYNFTIRCAALDVGRCVLPASTLTHLGLSGNGRFHTGLITALKSSGLEEMTQRGEALERELKRVIPTFVKRNRVDERLGDIDAKMQAAVHDYLDDVPLEVNEVTLVPRADDADELVASVLFPYTNLSLAQITQQVSKMGMDDKMSIIQLYVGERESRRDRTGRGFEAGYPLVFDIVGTFGEYRDLERHRMLTQQRQSLGVGLGFVLPPEMGTVGLEDEVMEVVGRMEELNGALRDDGLGQAAQYATLFNHRIRFMMGMNARELQHLTELRTQPAGHFGYRSVAMQMAKEAIERNPLLRPALGFVDYSDPGNKIARAGEQARIAGKNLSAGVSSDIDLT